MAVLTSIIPADSAVEVWSNQHVVAVLEDPAGIDRTLVEIIINGESHTVANGRLEYWGHMTIAGGEIVEDWTAVHFGTRGSWFDLSGQPVNIEVIYDSVTLDTITVRVSEIDGHPAATSGHYAAWATTPDWQAGRADGRYFILNYYPDGERVGWYYVEPPSDGAMDGWYLIGHPIRGSLCSGMTVGDPIRGAMESGVVIEGWARGIAAGGATVQGVMRSAGASGMVVAVPFRAALHAGAVIGRDLRTVVPAGAVIRRAAEGPLVLVAALPEDVIVWLRNHGYEL